MNPKKGRSLRCALVATSALPFAVVQSPVASGQEAYTYDQLGRLEKVTYGVNGSITYNYDENGNRTSVAIATPSTPPPSPPLAPLPPTVVLRISNGYLVLPMPH